MYSPAAVGSCNGITYVYAPFPLLPWHSHAHRVWKLPPSASGKVCLLFRECLMAVVAGCGLPQDILGSCLLPSAITVYTHIHRHDYHCQWIHGKCMHILCLPTLLILQARPRHFPLRITHSHLYSNMGCVFSSSIYFHCRGK